MTIAIRPCVMELNIWIHNKETYTVYIKQTQYFTEHLTCVTPYGCCIVRKFNLTACVSNSIGDADTNKRKNGDTCYAIHAVACLWEWIYVYSYQTNEVTVGSCKRHTCTHLYTYDNACKKVHVDNLFLDTNYVRSVEIK